MFNQSVLNRKYKKNRSINKTIRQRLIFYYKESLIASLSVGN